MQCKLDCWIKDWFQWQWSISCKSHVAIRVYFGYISNHENWCELIKFRQGAKFTKPLTWTSLGFCCHMEFYPPDVYMHYLNYGWYMSFVWPYTKTLKMSQTRCWVTNAPSVGSRQTVCVTFTDCLPGARLLSSFKQVSRSHSGNLEV